MNYTHVAASPIDDLDIEDDLQPIEAIPPRSIDLKHKIMYTCLGVFITAKILVICWIFTLSYPADALSHLFGW